MKNALQVVMAVIVTANCYSQDVTLTSHFGSSPTVYQIDVVSPIDTGYVSGTNILMQKAKMQKFDNNFGITGPGSIKGVNIGLPAVGGTGEIKVEIYPDVNGQADFLSPLASATFDLSSISTNPSSFTQLGSFATYNVQAIFSSPIAIPSNGKFWAGVVLPNPTTGAAVLYTTSLSTPFTSASTHSGEIWADDSFHFMNGPQTWGVDLAFAIFPIVNFTSSADLEMNSLASLVVYPNPTNGILQVSSEEMISEFNVLSLNGNIVASSTTSSINVEELSSGMYIYEIVSVSGKIVRGNFSKN